MRDIPHCGVLSLHLWMLPQPATERRYGCAWSTTIRKLIGGEFDYGTEMTVRSLQIGARNVASAGCLRFWLVVVKSSWVRLACAVELVSVVRVKVDLTNIFNVKRLSWWICVYCTW